MNRFKTSAARVNLAREIAGESMILLKNDGLLPLKAGSTAAVFGKGQVSLYIGGSGSGASSARNATKLVDTLKADGLKLIPSLEQFYLAQFDPEKEERERKELFAKFGDLVASGAIYEWFGTYTPPEEEQKIPPQLLEEAVQATDTAILVLGRTAGGEECDRHYENDYELLDSEKELIETVTSSFKNVALVMNTVGAIDLS